MALVNCFPALGGSYAFSALETCHKCYVFRVACSMQDFINDVIGSLGRFLNALRCYWLHVIDVILFSIIALYQKSL